MVSLNKKILIIIIFSCLLVYSSTIHPSSAILNSGSSSSRLADLDASFPVFINSDDDFDTLGFTGNGSSSNPYLIENLDIVSTGDGNPAIVISGTNVYFIIRNCDIVTKYIGIFIQSTVLSGTAKILNNTLSSSITYGGGIAIGSNYTLIENNTISGFMQGIHLNEAHHCTIKGNDILLSYYQGINIRDSSYNDITNNSIRNSNEHGLVIVGNISMYNIIYHNTFVNNSNEPTYNIDGVRTGDITSQGYDEGSSNQWFEALHQYGNWWDDYDGAGTYSIDGPADSFDQYPMKYEVEQTEEGSFFLFASILAIIGLAVLIIRKRRNSLF